MHMLQDRWILWDCVSLGRMMNTIRKDSRKRAMPRGRPGWRVVPWRAAHSVPERERECRFCIYLLLAFFNMCRSECVCASEMLNALTSWMRCSPLKTWEIASVRLAVKRIFEADKASKAAHLGSSAAAAAAIHKGSRVCCWILSPCAWNI